MWDRTIEALVDCAIYIDVSKKDYSYKSIILAIAS